MPNARPFIKFPGGKTRLLDQLIPRVPEKFGRYYEPFVGGGAVFFKLAPEKAWISDVNEELILAYQTIRDDVESIIRYLPKLPYKPGDLRTSRKHFEKIREMDRTTGFSSVAPHKKVARMIYLNKTCFNGLYRVNSKNQFNAPFGKYMNPTILDADNLRECSKVLKKTTIKCCSYLDAFEGAEKGSFFYLDPPYVPVSDTANFTSYTSDGFSMADHEALADACSRLDKKKIKFMLTNSNSPIARKLYKGFKIEKVDSPRAINRDGDGRKSSDIIIRNY